MDVRFALRLAGALRANVVEYVSCGVEICTLSGSPLGGGVGLVGGGVLCLLDRTLSIEDCLVQVVIFAGNGLLWGALANLVLSLPLFAIAGCLAPPGERREIPEGSLLSQLHQTFPICQFLGSLALSVAVGSCLLLVRFTPSWGWQRWMWGYGVVWLGLGATMGAWVGGVAGVVRSVNLSNDFWRHQRLRQTVETIDLAEVARIRETVRGGN